MNKLKCNVDSVATISSHGGEMHIVTSPKTTGSKEVVMGRSRLPGYEKVKPHVHDYSEETFFVIKGRGKIYMQGHGDVEFSVGDSILVPKGVVHWIENTSEETMEVIFAVAPLAPSPELGHRVINLEDIKA